MIAPDLLARLARITREIATAALPGIVHEFGRPPPAAELVADIADFYASNLNPERWATGALAALAVASDEQMRDAVRNVLVPKMRATVADIMKRIAS